MNQNFSNSTSSARVHRVRPDLAVNYRQVRHQLDGAIRGQLVCDEVLDRIGEWLERLPLAADEFRLANTRLANARRYLESGERHAARYEARLLRGLLAMWAERFLNSSC